MKVSQRRLPCYDDIESTHDKFLVHKIGQKPQKSAIFTTFSRTGRIYTQNGQTPKIHKSAKRINVYNIKTMFDKNIDTRYTDIK